MSEPVRPASDTDRLSLLALANVALRHRWLVLRVAAVVLAGTAAYFLLRTPTYTVTTTFRPQTRSSIATNLTGLAAQFGFAMPTTDAAQTPAFYVDLLRSREILGSAVTHHYPIADPAGATVDLIEAFEVRGTSAGVRRERAMEKLSDAMTVIASPRTGVITLDVTLRDPVLAEAVTRRLIDEVNTFNLKSRKSQAGAERRFVEGRLDEVRQDLRGAEDRLETFLRRNRDYRNSPQLTFEQERLHREVTMQQGIYSSLAQMYEEAKIEEVRDTPVITVIDQPERPAVPDRRGLLRKVIIAFLLGGALGLGIAFLREGIARHRRTGSEELEEFRELRQEALDELRLRRRRKEVI